MSTSEQMEARARLRDRQSAAIDLLVDDFEAGSLSLELFCRDLIRVSSKVDRWDRWIADIWVAKALRRASVAESPKRGRGRRSVSAARRKVMLDLGHIVQREETLDGRPMPLTIEHGLRRVAEIFAEVGITGVTPNSVHRAKNQKRTRRLGVPE